MKKFNIIFASFVLLLLFGCNEKKELNFIEQVKKAKMPIEYDMTSEVDSFDVVKLGKYYIHDKNGKEKDDIEWLVLDRDEERALLISKYVIINYPYNSETVDVFWQNSSLRKYLNNEFYNEAFSEEDKKLILKSNIDNPRNFIFNTYCGENTEDNVFCLSLDECVKYFGPYIKDTEEEKYFGTDFGRFGYPSMNRRACAKASNYIIESTPQGIISPTWYGDYTWYILRTNGVDNKYHTNVHPNGFYHIDGDWVNEIHYSVRPAIYVSLKNE